jgi:methionyl-tRNA formyltransferase
MGTSEFGIPSLRVLAEKHDIAAVVSRPDSCRGRGLKLQFSPVKTEALEMGLEVLTPVRLNEPEFIQKLRDFEADIFFVVAFRILPEEVFTIPPRGSVNLHASLLPDYRGAAPINRAIMNGDTETGLTTFFIEKTVDTGDIILTERVIINPEENAGELSARMSANGAELGVRTLELIGSGQHSAAKQVAVNSRPAPKLTKEDARIDWSPDAVSVHNHIRGTNPCPGAFTQWGDRTLRILRAKVEDAGSRGIPGIIKEASPSKGIVVSCGKGSVRLVEVQPEGKKAMDAASFVRGYRITGESDITKGGT